MQTDEKKFLEDTYNIIPFERWLKERTEYIQQFMQRHKNEKPIKVIEFLLWRNECSMKIGEYESKQWEVLYEQIESVRRKDKFIPDKKGLVYIHGERTSIDDGLEYLRKIITELEVRLAVNKNMAEKQKTILDGGRPKGTKKNKETASTNNEKLKNAVDKIFADGHGWGMSNKLITNLIFDNKDLPDYKDLPNYKRTTLFKKVSSITAGIKKAKKDESGLKHHN